MNFSNIYNINFARLSNLLTPPFLRKERLIDWLIALLSPLEEVNFKFRGFRDFAIYQVTHNGQVHSLQAVLNDSFDNELRRIRIKDSNFIEPVYVYPEADERPVHIYREGVDPVTYIQDDSIFIDLEIDFIVCVPIEYQPIDSNAERLLLIQIASLVDYYKLASKRYRIIWT